MWSTTSEKHLGSFSESISKPTDNGGRSDADRTYSEGIICRASPVERRDFCKSDFSASNSKSWFSHDATPCSGLKIFRLRGLAERRDGRADLGRVARRRGITLDGRGCVLE